ncbi:MAG: hypothetical protein NZ516_10850, partial [Raineya sp.]|nr:hypothetical protein [Raineya sp.]
SVHRFLALSLLIAYITLITENFEKIPRNFKMIFLPILALFFLKMYGGNFYNSWKGNLEARKKIMKIGDEELSFEKRDVVKYLLNPFQFNWQKAKKLFSDSLQINLQKNDYYKFMRKIAELDSLPVAEKKEALLYIPFHKVHFPQWETIYATQDGMFLASISGLALLSGLPHPKYQVGAYGYGYYDHSLREKTWLQGFSLDELKKLTLQRGFRNLYIYQPETQSFEKIICSEPAK